MKNSSFKSLVLTNFPELTVKRNLKYPELFVMLNKHGETFCEKMTSYSSKQTWKIAHSLMLRGELKPYWKEESEKSLKESQEKLIEAKKDKNRKFITKKQVHKLTNEVLKEFGYK